MKYTSAYVGILCKIFYTNFSNVEVIISCILVNIAACKMMMQQTLLLLKTFSKQFKHWNQRVLRISFMGTTKRIMTTPPPSSPVTATTHTLF